MQSVKRKCVQGTVRHNDEMASAGDRCPQWGHEHVVEHLQLVPRVVDHPVIGHPARRHPGDRPRHLEVESIEPFLESLETCQTRHVLEAISSHNEGGQVVAAPEVLQQRNPRRQQGLDCGEVCRRGEELAGAECRREARLEHLQAPLELLDLSGWGGLERCRVRRRQRVEASVERCELTLALNDFGQ